MKKIKVVLSLLLSGSIFLCVFCLTGFSFGRVSGGVVVNGVNVGGLAYGKAEALVRRQIAETLPPLKVCAPKETLVVRYPALSFTDNVARLVRRARAGERLTAEVRRQWADAEAQILSLCERNARPARDAEVSFDGTQFTYRGEEAGLTCDYRLTLMRVWNALKSGEGEVELAVREDAPYRTEARLRQCTATLSRFSTRFDASNGDRVYNIRLAAEKINGAIVKPHTGFSFNEAVGKRTREAGFRESVVIFDGEFVKGVGGGVCQLSTTLYNAALHAGLTVTESRSHSLSVSYVPPSLDAMVSEYSDLKLVNPYDEPIYIGAFVSGNSVTVNIFGLPDGRRYETESVVLYRLPPPPALEVEGAEERIIRAGKEGLASESYLLVYEGETLVSRTLLRRDNYAVVQEIRQIVRNEEEKEGETQNFIKN